MRRVACLLSALALLHILVSTSASADAGGEGTIDYEAATAVGLREFELGNYIEARSQFLDALSAFPNARVFRALGKVEYELKSYVAAIDYLERSLAHEAKPLSDEQRKDVTALLANARAYVGRYTVRVRPSSARLSLDGQPLALGRDGEVLMQVGNHVIEAQAPGYMSAREQLAVVGRKSGTIELTLLPISTADSSEAARVDKPLYKKWWLWTSVALVVCGGVTAAAILATRDKQPSEPSGGNSSLVWTIPDESATR